MKVGIIGIGFVGSAIRESFLQKHNIDLICYDKYKSEYNTFKDCLECKVLFLCLPTPYSSKLLEYDKQAIDDVCQDLYNNNYKGSVVLKSTVEPGTIASLAIKFSTLNLIHNPEFLTARTAVEDYHAQKHIILGRHEGCNIKEYEQVVKFHETTYPEASVTQCTSMESECMKLFANSFYAVKVQFFTELFLLCQQVECDFNKIRDMILKNGWVNPMHTDVPGPDGEVSYGGLCFPKDTNALLRYMEAKGVSCKVLQGTIEGRNIIRKDSENCS